MLRLTELKLPLDHPPEALPVAIVERLGIAPEDLLAWRVARPANDARKKSAILLIYSIDVTLRDETAVLERSAGDHRIRPTPDTDYHPPVTAPTGWAGTRPL